MLKNIVICFRIFETLIVPFAIPFFLIYVGFWQWLPFLSHPELRLWSLYLQIVANVAGLMGIFWFLTYEFFHNFIVEHYATSKSEYRKWYRNLEWILSTPSLVAMMALPGIYVALTKFTLGSAEKFVFDSAPKPKGQNQQAADMRV